MYKSVNTDSATYESSQHTIRPCLLAINNTYLFGMNINVFLSWQLLAISVYSIWDRAEIYLFNKLRLTWYHRRIAKHFPVGLNKLNPYIHTKSVMKLELFFIYVWHAWYAFYARL